MDLVRLLKVLSPFILIAFIFVMAILVLRLFVSKKVTAIASLFLGCAYFSLVFVLIFTASGQAGYATLYNFIKVAFYYSLKLLVFFSANIFEIFEGLFSFTFAVFALLSLISLILQICNAVELSTNSKTFKYKFSNFDFISNHPIRDEKIHSTNLGCSLVLNC